MKTEITSFNMSASSLGMFEECRRKWAHSALYKSSRDEVEQRPFKIGTAMHALIENFYLLEKFDKQWLFDNWERYYAKELVNITHREEDIEIGYEALHNLYSILKRHDWLQPAWKVGKMNGVECYFKFPFQGHDKYVVNLSGKIDLLLKRKDAICVIDWKTGKNVKYQVDDLSESIQLILYSIALKKMFDVEHEKLFLVYFYADKVKEFEVTNEHFQIVKQKVNNFLDVYHTKKFAKAVSWTCNRCEFRSVCQGKTGSIML